MTLEPQHEALVRCLQSCTTRAEHCAEMATSLDPHARCVPACRDAAALCRLGAELVARESAMAAWLLPIVELACATCAEACEERMGIFFRDCARQCRELHGVLDRMQRRATLARGSARGAGSPQLQPLGRSH